MVIHENFKFGAQSTIATMRGYISFVFLFFFVNCFAQTSVRPGSSEIYQNLQKLNFLGSALYFAAHPDDENTRMISFLSNEVHANTAYLSITRGDGGQNLIGTEIREELGVLRTHELLSARRIDGGTQYFTRANDFGYSKHPDETFAIWNEEEVLSDAVWVIRNFQPDIIINRFDHRTPGTTHGHHTASAVLSLEAAEKAADASVFPEQLKDTEVWETSRVYYNTSWWRYPGKTREERQASFAAADKSQLVRVDIGTYDPISGSSLSEVAIRSRSQHLSQGFGAIPYRGSTLDYLEPIVGGPIEDNTNVFDGINTTWSRVKGGAHIGDKVQDIIDEFDFTAPEKSVPSLLTVYKAIDDLPDSYWKRVKLEETAGLIEAACGMFLEFIVDENKVTPGDEVNLEYEIVNRSNHKMSLNKVEVVGSNYSSSEKVELPYNESITVESALNIPASTGTTAPYWLTEKGDLGMYNVPEQALRGAPITPHPLKALCTFEIAGTRLTIEKPVVHKYRDPAKGEIYRPFEITPAVFVALDKSVYLFSSSDEQEIATTVTAGKADVNGSVKLNIPKGWKCEPASQNFNLERKGAEQKLVFKVSPSKKQSIGEVSAEVSSGGETFTRSVVELEYEHVPHQAILKPASSTIVRVPLEKGVNKIGYINGAGDLVADNLREVGYHVDELDIASITPGQLAQYDAILLGIRIYNMQGNGTILNVKQPLLFDYVKQGGTLITQYNTSHRVQVDQVAPYELKLSRDRVTDEFAAVTILAPDHRVLNFPNKIGEADFENWVQERGLYFPNEWGKEFTPILAWNDKGEDPKEGSLLIAEHGEGHFVYTGISWFRELPAGVPGAYRILANIIALGVDEK